MNTEKPLQDAVKHHIDEKDALNRKAQAANCAATVLADECGTLRKRVAELEDFLVASRKQSASNFDAFSAAQERIRELEVEKVLFDCSVRESHTFAFLADCYNDHRRLAAGSQNHIAAADQREKAQHYARALNAIESTTRWEREADALRIGNGRLTDLLNDERAAHEATKARIAELDAQLAAAATECAAGAHMQLHLDRKLKEQCETCEIKALFDGNDAFARKCKAELGEANKRIAELEFARDSHAKTSIAMCECLVAIGATQEMFDHPPRLFDWANNIKARIAELETELAESRKDSERLDWMEDLNQWPMYYDGLWFYQKTPDTYDTLRAAIDAARKEDGK